MSTLNSVRTERERIRQMALAAADATANRSPGSLAGRLFNEGREEAFREIAAILSTPMLRLRTMEVEVVFMESERVFICGVLEGGTLDDLKDLEDQLQPELDDYYQQGEGVYAITATYFPGQPADYEAVGYDWEIPPGWEPTVRFIHGVGDPEQESP